MNRAVLVVLAVLFLSGCAGTMAVLDALSDEPKPVPVCNEKTLGAKYDGKWCLLFTDGHYGWVEQRYKGK